MESRTRDAEAQKSGGLVVTVVTVGGPVDRDVMDILGLSGST